MAKKPIVSPALTYEQRLEQFVGKIRAARKAINVTMRDVEVKAGVASSVLSNLENGRIPGPNILSKVVTYLGLDHEEAKEVYILQQARKIERRFEGFGKTGKA